MSQAQKLDKPLPKLPEMPELKDELNAIAGQYEHRSTAMLPLLYHVQRKTGYIPPELEKVVAGVLGVSATRVHEVVTFYTLFHTRPVGKIHLQLCHTLSCSLCGAEKIFDALKKKYDLDHGSMSPDGKLSLERVECLAACDIGPVARLNDDYVGNLTPEKLIQIIEEKIKNA